jgi:hypothetical protein
VRELPAIEGMWEVRDAEGLGVQQTGLASQDSVRRDCCGRPDGSYGMDSIRSRSTKVSWGELGCPLRRSMVSVQCGTQNRQIGGTKYCRDDTEVWEVLAG